ncbi:MAG: ubiquinol-cytochrome c reductase cytochrome c subunit [Actinomycetota bacterium]|nr:ubiquinol-cytochrome c reductase cytochrome c subunit [Actinomycetota bacterium]
MAHVRRADRRSRALASALPFAAVACFGVVGFVHAGAVARGVTAASAPNTASSTASSTTSTLPDVSASDAHLVYLRDCATCHGADARGTAYGPSLQGVGGAAVDYWVSSGRMPLVDEGRPAKSPQGRAPPGQYLADPNARIARHPPAYPPATIAALVRYVAAIAPGGPAVPSVDLAHSSLSDGGQIFRLQCAACHAWSGVGGALYQRAAPSLHSATPTQIAEAIRIGPGQMPAFGTAAIPADQVDAVVAYVRYLDHPENRGGQPLWYLGPVAEGGVAILLGLAALLLATRWIGSRG